MTYALLPLSSEPRQVFTLDLSIDGEAFHAQVELRYLPAPDLWVVSVWDHSSGELLVNQVSLVCSYGKVNDLLLPFRYLRGGKGLGSMFCLRRADEPGAENPGRGNLGEFRVLWGDTVRESST